MITIQGGWVFETQAEADTWLAGAAERNQREAARLAVLRAEQARNAAWRAARKAPAPAYPQGRKLDCGCTVYQASEVMSASLGTACPQCYDRMAG